MLLFQSPAVVSTSVGTVSSLAAIVLVLISRAYKEFIQRLFLYLAITATLLCTSLLSVYIVTFITLYDKNNTSITFSKADIDFQTVISFPLEYFALVYALLLCWIGVYVTSLTMGTATIFKSTRREVIGLAIVTITPLTVVWIVPVMRNHYNCNFGTFVLPVIAIMLLLSVLMTTLSVGAVIFQLCRSGLKCNSSVHVRALKEATPLLTFVVIHQIAVGSLLTYSVVLLLTHSAELPPKFLVVLYFSLLFLFASNPLVLLCQPRIRHGMICKKRQQQQSVGVWNPTTGIQDVTSQTHYIVPPETSFTEEDSLIIKQ